MHTAAKLRNVVCTKTHFPVAKFRTEIHFAARIGGVGNGAFAFAALGGRQWTIRTAEVQDRIDNKVDGPPGINMRLIAAAKHIVNSKMLCVICEQLLIFYHLKRMQGIRLKLASRAELCQWLLQQYIGNLFLVCHAVHPDQETSEKRPYDPQGATGRT
jgi:hypothetical protein